MEYILLNDRQKEKYSNDLLTLIQLCDNDFVPPLSQRNSTVQKTLKPHDNAKSENGVLKYYNEMMHQHILAVLEGSVLVGFGSFRENVVSDVIPEDYTPNIYISTIIMHPNTRGKGIATGLYTHLLESFGNSRNMITRTWSTNTAHIRILEKFGFAELHCIPNDRGNEIDTVYFLKSNSNG